jgi:hypothetical protein
MKAGKEGKGASHSWREPRPLAGFQETGLRASEFSKEFKLNILFDAKEFFKVLEDCQEGRLQS